MCIRDRTHDAQEDLVLDLRLLRLERRFDEALEKEVVETAKGSTLSQIARGLLDAIDADAVLAQAKQGNPETFAPAEKEIREALELRCKEALAPLAANPDLRNLLKKIHQASEQTIDVISQDTLLHARAANQSTQTAAQTATKFREFLEQHRAEIDALQVLYSRPYRQRLTEPMLKELEDVYKRQNRQSVRLASGL